MSNGEKLSEPAHQENFRAEYGVVSDAWKFLVGLRFLVAGFTTTLQSALFTFYNQVVKDVTVEMRLSKAGITLLGLFTITAIMLIEQRTTVLFRRAMKRGSEIEFYLGLSGGFFQRFTEPTLVRPRGLGRFVRHGWGIRLIYVVIFGFWLVLFGINVSPWFVLKLKALKFW